VSGLDREFSDRVPARLGDDVEQLLIAVRHVEIAPLHEANAEPVAPHVAQADHSRVRPGGRGRFDDDDRVHVVARERDIFPEMGYVPDQAPLHRGIGVRIDAANRERVRFGQADVLGEEMPGDRQDVDALVTVRQLGVGRAFLVKLEVPAQHRRRSTVDRGSLQQEGCGDAVDRDTAEAFPGMDRQVTDDLELVVLAERLFLEHARHESGGCHLRRADDYGIRIVCGLQRKEQRRWRWERFEKADRLHGPGGGQRERPDLPDRTVRHRFSS